MKRFTISALAFATKTYCLLTKPGIIAGNAITTVAGFALASKGKIDFGLLLATLLGLSLVIASACVFNNYIDRIADGKMKRTQNRALVKGWISPRHAIVFAILLGLLGSFILTVFSNLLSTWIALVGFFVYVVVYSFSKYHSMHGTLIGSIAGAVPPVVGYCSVSNHLDAGALILFAMMALWQMPHFFAIAIYRMEDYISASIPVLPIKKGVHSTKIQMLFYIAAFTCVSSLLTLFGYAGQMYLITVMILGLSWLGLCLTGFKCANDQLWARKMFFFSLAVIIGICIAIPFSLP